MPSVTAPPEANPAGTIPPFAEARGGRAESTETDLIKTDADSLPAAAVVAVRSETAIPEFAPARKGTPRAAQPASEKVGQPSVSSPQASSSQLSFPHGSLDDRAPAPLPDPAPASVQAHVADAPPLPDSAAAPALPREARASYIEPEPIFEEPDWDDIGMPFGDSAADPLLQPAPAQPASGQPDLVQPNLRQAAVIQRAAARPAAVLPVAGNSGLQDLRAHPLYQEATRMWAGRVKEVGKVKPKAPDEAGAEADLPEVLAEEELA